MASVERALKIKERGNKLFKEQKYRDALDCYSEALLLVTEIDYDRTVLLKNRAACWLKLKDYDKALADCVAALEISPGDVKAIYRHAQALEGRGDIPEALRMVKKLLGLEPKNREGLEMARRLAASIKQQSDRLQSTDGIMGEMFAALASSDTPIKGRIQATKNLAILSREPGGSGRIFQAGGVSKMITLLSDNSPEIVHHSLQCLVGLCSGHKVRSCSILQFLPLEKVSSLISSPHTNVAISAITVLKEIIASVANEQVKEVTDQDSINIVLPILQMLFISLASYDVLADTRDCILELFVKTLPLPGVALLYLENKVVGHVLQIASQTGDEEEEVVVLDEEALNLPVSEECRMNVSMVLATLHDNLSKKEKELFKAQCAAFVLPRLQNKSCIVQREALSAFAAILQGVVEVGNSLLSEDIVLKVTTQLAESCDTLSMAIAAETLSLAVTDKTNTQLIIEKAMGALKTLYHCHDESVCVRALVGLCKVGSSGGGNINARPFAEGADLKLANTCRRVLVSTKKSLGLKKWAAEGLAFLSLEAEVKEAIIKDEAVLKVLFSMAKSPDKSLLYGVSTLFVNLTNSYDKPERNPELEELGKFAGENVPKEHEWDGEEYVKKRVEILLKAGVIPTLVALSKTESKKVHEQVARVFRALSIEQKHRGVIIQQGGTKCLIPLSSDNTKPGQLIAGQALAKIGITNDPNLAFPGQRKMEVVRPLSQLLKSESGLQQFEGLMALTNLASLGDEVRKRIFSEGAVIDMEGLMFEEHEMIRRAATEALCNMIPLQEVHERFYNDDIERVKLWTLFSGEDDPALARAASGGLAILSRDPKICQKIMTVTKSREILKELVTSDSHDLQYRGMHILANLVEADKQIAAKIIEEDFLEIFLAYAQGLMKGSSSEAKIEAERALQKAVEYELIQPNPQ